MIQTAEGALQQTTDILQRMRELVVKGQNSGVLQADDKKAIQTEIDALAKEIDRIAASTTFNKKVLLNGDLDGTADTKKAFFKIGANDYAEDMLTVTINSMSASTLGVNALKVDTDADAEAALTAIDDALGDVSEQRAKLGAAQNRMEYAIENLSTTSENLSAAESRIRDVDMAEEMVNYTKSNILNQTAMAMLAQANQQPQQILSLLS